ncbi:hypothetical protein ACFSQQ_35620 [Mesorhizobium kowhaii]|uniref:hypothetical protein n=1 Tax=Mesorhizobium kowhaii TaxID=1300272 RepID=UPI0035EC591E
MLRLPPDDQEWILIGVLQQAVIDRGGIDDERHTIDGSVRGDRDHIGQRIIHAGDAFGAVLLEGKGAAIAGKAERLDGRAIARPGDGCDRQ